MRSKRELASLWTPSASRRSRPSARAMTASHMPRRCVRWVPLRRVHLSPPVRARREPMRVTSNNIGANWYEISTLGDAFGTKKPRLSGAFSNSGGGIRTRDLRVMSCIDRGAVMRSWLYRAQSGSPGSPQICSDRYERWYETKLSNRAGLLKQRTPLRAPAQRANRKREDATTRAWSSSKSAA